MKSIQTKASNPQYIVKVGKDGQHRLNIVQQIFWPTTKLFLANAGLKQGMTVIDAGCGIGELTIEMAKIIGPHGKIFAIDDSQEQLQIAKENARAAHIYNIIFICSSIENINFDLIGTNVDFVFGRFILIHLPNPELALQALYNLLNHNGIMAFEELGMSAYTAVPPNKAVNKAISWCMSCGKALGVDFDMGKMLYFIMELLGLENLQFSLQQPVIMSQPQKSVISLLTSECKQKYLELQIANADEIDLVIKQLEVFENAPYTYYEGAKQYQVFGIKTCPHKTIDTQTKQVLKAAIAGKFLEL